MPMFRFIVTKDPYFITKLLVLLKPMCCAPGDYVMHAGEPVGFLQSTVSD